MGSLIVNLDGDKYNVDEFFKSLMFQRIMDGDFSRDERDVLLVIFRKTVHFNKWYDHLGIYFLSKAVGVGQAKLRKVLTQLKEKGLIDIEQSKGGKTDSNKKFSKFSISENLIFLVADRWVDIKIEKDYDLESYYA